MCSYSAFISSFQKMLFQLLQILNNVILKQKREFEKKTGFENHHQFVFIKIFYIYNVHYLLYCNAIKEKFS